MLQGLGCTGCGGPAGGVGDVEGDAGASLTGTSDEVALHRASRTRTQSEASLAVVNPANVCGRGTGPDDSAGRWQNGWMSDQPAEVTLSEITRDTVREIMRLEVAETQKGFVAPNSVSIA